MKRIILLLTCLLSLSHLALAVAPVSLPYTYQGITFNHAFTYANSAGTHTCYFKNPTHSSIQYPAPYYGVESDAMYSPDDSCGGTYLAHNTRLIFFVTDPPYCSTCGIVISCSLTHNTWSSFNMAVPSWWSAGGTSICGVSYYLNDSLYPPGDPDTPFVFPLQTTCDGNPCTAYTAGVSSMMDQSMPSGPYTKNGITQAFNGEEGDVDTGCWCYSTSSACNSGNYQNCAVPGYLKTGGGGWSFDSIIGYSDIYLYYDGHPGYDYPASQGTDINAPESGTLCIATTVTEPDDPPVLWRDTTRCPHSTDGGTSWSGYHTFYIIHDGLRMNGVAGKYMTVFLHNDSLSSTVQSAIEQNGYAEISKDDHVADVGDVGATGHYHMHLEVYKWNGSGWDRVDPYGDGTNNILWEH